MKRRLNTSVLDEPNHMHSNTAADGASLVLHTMQARVSPLKRHGAVSRSFPPRATSTADSEATDLRKHHAKLVSQRQRK